MQNCNEIPTLDFTYLQEEDMDYFIYMISELCDKYDSVVIRVIRDQEVVNE